MSAVGAFGSTASFGSLGVPSSTPSRETVTTGTNSVPPSTGTADARETASVPTSTPPTQSLRPNRAAGVYPEGEAEVVASEAGKANQPAPAAVGPLQGAFGNTTSGGNAARAANESRAAVYSSAVASTIVAATGSTTANSTQGAAPNGQPVPGVVNSSQAASAAIAGQTQSIASNEAAAASDQSNFPNQSGEQDSRAQREIFPANRVLREQLADAEVLGADMLVRPQSFDPVASREDLSSRISDLVDKFEEVLERIDQFVIEGQPTPNQPVPLPNESKDSSLDDLVTTADKILEGILVNAGALINNSDKSLPTKPRSGVFNDPELNVLL